MHHASRSLRSLAALAAFALAAASQAQIDFPAASPRSVVKQTVGLTEIEIDYSRPSAKGREIFGGLVPYGEVWRAGANAPTTIAASHDITLGGQRVPAGRYALYAIPGEDAWTIIVYNSTELWGSYGYDSAKDLVRFQVEPSRLDRHVESLSFSFDALRNDDATLNLDWADVRVSIPVGVDASAQVMRQIDSLKDKPEFQNPNTLFGAGSFYHDAGENLEQALAWVTQAVESRDEPAFWMYARKARIELDLGRKAEALASARRTLELATQAGNADYVRIAEDLIEQLS